MADEKLAALAQGLNGVVTTDGMVLSAEVVDGEVDMVKVEIEDREEFPVYITADDEQMLCTTYLWTEAEVDANKRANLLEAMLTMNLPMPLSSFGKVADQYLIFGAIAAQSGIEHLQHEVCVLSDNSLNAVEAMQDYLK